jgi:hypothetical protein
MCRPSVSSSSSSPPRASLDSPTYPLALPSPRHYESPCSHRVRDPVRATPRHEYIYIDRPSRHFSFAASPLPPAPRSHSRSLSLSLARVRLLSYASRPPLQPYPALSASLPRPAKTPCVLYLYFARGIEEEAHDRKS